MPNLPPISKSRLRDTRRSPFDPCSITDLRQEKESRLQEVLASISRLQKMHDSLSLEKQRLINLIAKNRAMISPFKRLPVDIVEEIFYHCLPVAHNAVTSVHEPPLVLGRVCKTWRQVAYSTPRLWTSIHIVAILSGRSTYLEERDAELGGISAWISRSGALPLSISIFHDDPLPQWPGQSLEYQIQPYLDTLYSQLHRWKSIYFTFRDINWTDILSRIHSEDVPLLEELQIIDNIASMGWTVSSEDVDIISAFSRQDGVLCAPRLRSLSLPHYIAHTLSKDMRWERITSLDITYHHIPFLGDFGRIAIQCSNLTHLTIAFTPVWSTFQGSDPWPSSFIGETDPLSPPLLIPLPSLQYLSILARPANDDGVYQTLTALSTPALRHLTWQRPSVDPLDPPVESRMVESFEVFVARLVNPLEELHLILDFVCETTLIDILSLVPSLKRLSLAGEPPHIPPYSPLYVSSSQLSRFFGDHFLQEFTPGTLPGRDEDVMNIGPEGSGGPRMFLCPDLEVVHFLGVEFTPESVAMFLRSRAATNLRKLSILFASDRPEHLHKEHRDGIPELENLAQDNDVQFLYLEYNIKGRDFSPPAPPAPAHRAWAGLANPSSSAPSQRFHF
ncbi:hypothetical protein NP233_g4091 [Leucocoprinus birnbaumii]|uniref:F-box domain-containing protein n=1 Tax=Leucocoprinus birnbaumii TaxID=56174 RepID=A0AAD5VVB9_9AGAR|nr:hypothetical protein NP233_g4091 [Leucocoprinus birnbaumii]